ncbi:BTB/POZ protein [Biscogniauxia marginata]|nr:BTB/POZ protein [Biscogniauxia marginata]
MAEINSDGMIANADERLLNSGILADVEVICGDKTWKLHKAIICPRSKYFEKAFTGKFTEAQTNRIIVQDQHPIHMNWVVYFIYTGKFTADLQDLLAQGRTSLLTAADVLRLGDFFFIDHFGLKALEAVRVRFVFEASNVQIYCRKNPGFKKKETKAKRSRRVQQPQQQQGAQDSAAAAAAATAAAAQEGPLSLDFINGFFAVVKEAYAPGTSPGALRMFFVEFVRATRWLAMKKEAFSQEVYAIPEFARDILADMMQSEVTKVLDALPTVCAHCDRTTMFCPQTWWSQEDNCVKGSCLGCSTSLELLKDPAEVAWRKKNME